MVELKKKSSLIIVMKSRGWVEEVERGLIAI
jgi:hypothetical protein